MKFRITWPAILLLASLSAHAIPVVIEPDDYRVRTDLSNISPFVTLSRGLGTPVFATQCCGLGGGTAPTGNLIFGNFAFYVSPDGPFADPRFDSLVARFNQPVDDVTFLVNWIPASGHSLFGVSWATYDEAGSLLGPAGSTQTFMTGDRAYAVLIHPSPQMRYLTIGGWDSIAALRIDRMSFTVVPEPASLILFSIGLMGIAASLGRRHPPS